MYGRGANSQARLVIDCFCSKAHTFAGDARTDSRSCPVTMDFDISGVEASDSTRVKLVLFFSLLTSYLLLTFIARE